MLSLFQTHFFTKTPHGEERGFTIVEVVICVAIIALISATVIFQYQRFNSGLLLKNTGYEIALAIREAQSLGIGVRGAGEDFGSAYGAHFATGASYLLFRDTNNNGRYDNATLDTVISSSTIGRRNSITMLCSGRPRLAGAECSKSHLDIMFERPNPDALFYEVPDVVLSSTAATIRVAPLPTGASSTVTVSSTGQITVE